MEIQALGYVGVRARTLADWATYGRDFLGFQLVDRSSKTLSFRMDDRKQRIVVDEDGGDGLGFFGWEVESAAALGALAARLERAQVLVMRGSRALAEQRKVADLIVFHDPVGNRLEAFHGAEIASDAFVPGRNISGFRTGPLGMGHVVLDVDNIDAVRAFYQDLLGFRLSDYITQPFKAYFFHVNPRHHSLAFIERGKVGVHHVMVELFNFDDVGQGYDIALTAEDRIGTTLGRHVNDYVTSFYANTPSRFMMEYGWGGRVVDMATWQPQEVTQGPSLWGHDRRWISPEELAESRAMRMRVAQEGTATPVQVLEGNHNLMPGTCPWWDETVRGIRAAG